MILIWTSPGNGVPALSARLPSTSTSPARIKALAFSSDSARPRSTRSRSRRCRTGFGFIGARKLRSAKDEILGDFPKARAAFRVGRKLSDRFSSKVAGNFVRAFQSVHGGIGRLLLRQILACSLAKRGRGLFDVENIVGDLEGPADGFAKPPEPCDVIGRRTGAKRTSRDRRADQRGGLGTVNVFEHLRVHGLAFGLDVRHLSADHSVYRAGGARNFTEHG